MTKIIGVSKISFTAHDLRRTFITIAESLDIPAYALKRLLNHKMNSDITAGHIIADVERLRKPMQQISDYREFLQGIKDRLKKAQIRAAMAANTELVRFYWQLGGDIIEQQKSTNGAIIF